jgi:hypothetical protein
VALLVSCSSSHQQPRASRQVPTPTPTPSAASTLPASPTPPAVASNAKPLRDGSCSLRQLVGVFAGGVSPETGEHSAVINVWNVSQTACTLGGYPRVQLRAAVKPLPFRYRVGGEYINDRPSSRLRLPPGQGVHFVIAKYRCDSGTLAAVTTVGYQVSARVAMSTLALPRDEGVSTLDFCKPFHGPTRDDPGNLVQVGPFVAGVFTVG